MLACLTCFAAAQAPATTQAVTSLGASQTEECEIAININDSGEIYLNGISVLKCPQWEKAYQAIINVKKGDVLTAIVNDVQGGASPGLAILVFKKLKPNKPFLTSKDFRYATSVKPDWQTNPTITGFRRSALKTLQGIILSNKAGAEAAWPEEKDRHFVTTFYKCIVP